MKNHFIWKSESACKDLWIRMIGLCFIICSFTNAHAQPAKLFFKHLTVENGLSQNMVSCILQDKEGYMWFGTYDGLNKYDGTRMSIYQNNPKDRASISGNRITALLEDKHDVLWVGTADGGLNRFDRDTGNFYPNHEGNTLLENFKSKSITSLYEDSRGNLLIGTHGNGLYIIDQKREKITNYVNKTEDPHSLIDNDVTSILEDKQGNLWIGTDSGSLERFDRKNNRFVHYSNEAAQINELRNKTINCLYEDRYGNLWIGTDKGLKTFDRKTHSFSVFLPNRAVSSPIQNQVILSLAEDSNGYLWIGTENGGMAVLDVAQSNNYVFKPIEDDPNSLNALSIYAIYKDRNQNMWIGTFNGGVNWVDHHRKKFKSYNRKFSTSAGLNNNLVNAIAEDQDGYIWIATDGGGLNRFNATTELVTYFKEIPGNANSIFGDFSIGLLCDKENNIWTGSWEKGITRIDSSRRIFTRFQYDPKNFSSISSNNGNFFAEDGNGNIWISTYGGGLNSFNKASGKFTRFQHNPDSNSISSNYLWVVMSDRQNHIWVGTLGKGVDHYNSQTKEIVNFKNDPNNPESLSNNDVYFLYEDTNGNIWIGTGSGLNKYMPGSETFSVFTTEQGLPSNAVISILEDSKGNLWLGTRKGLCKFNPSTKVVRNYTVEDGIQGVEFNNAALKSSTGEFYFGGTQGFTVFHPDSIYDSPVIPPVYLTNFQIFNKNVPIGTEGSPLKYPISETNEITLTYKQSVFSIEFSALDYSIPGKNQYAYKMENFDEQWNYIGNDHKATYTNLDPGTYVFKVKGSNSDDIWNEDGVSLSITITPPWWKTWWVRIVSISIIAGVVIGYFQSRILRIASMNQKLEHLVTDRTSELKEANQQLQTRQEEINSQNETLTLANDELLQRQEEIEMQRDSLAMHNEELIKARKIIEEQNREISSHNLTLDEEVRLRTQDLVVYTQQLEQFAFIAAHNLRAPVARILGLGEVLKLAPLSQEEGKSISDKLIQTTKELDMVVKDISTILEIRKNNALTFNEVNLQDQLKLIKANLDTEILSTEAIIIEDFSQINCIYSVKPYVQSILYNLLCNAIKYRDSARKPRIEISSQLAGAYLSITIKDNGLGIDLESHQKNLFTLYKRFHSHVEGKGMGLFLVKTQVTALGGRIEVESKVNQGTVFRIFLKNLNS